MQKKILLILLAFFISLPLRGTSIPFELAGEYQGLLRDPYQSVFSLEDALVIGMEGEIENARFYLAVGTETEGLLGEKLLKLNTGNLKNIMDFRGPKVPDMPMDFVAFLLQRLFPSQDGLNIIPNQLSKDDPVRAFTPQTIGVILNKIRDFYLTPPKDREKFKRDLAFAIDHNLNPLIPAFYDLGTSQKNEDAYVKREKVKKHKLVSDFTTTLLFALDDATQHPFYTPYFVHKILFSFALQKAGRVEDPRSTMKAFYAAMPDVVQEDFKLQDPFSKKMYAELKGRLMLLYGYQTPFELKQKAIETYGEGYRLSLREELCFLYGKKYFDSLFPKVHYTNTANYKGTSFSNCGENTVLNWLNLFLFDFAQKSIRIEMLDKMEGVYKPLQEYYHDFPTEEAQQSQKGQEAWIYVVSGHSQKVDPDLYYHKGEGTCEILHGFTSMAALMRALFPDETNCLIRDNQLLTPLERAKATFQHLVDKFSTEQETWAWSVDQAEEGKEHDVTKNDLVIHMVKSGKNVPMDGEEPITGPILSLTFNHGHYNASFSGGADDEYMDLYGLSVLKSLPNLKRSPSELDLSLSSLALTSFFFDSVFDDGEVDPRNAAVEKIFVQLSEETQNRLHMTSVLRPSLQNTTLRMALFTYFVALKSSPFYLMAANLLESLPVEDPTMVSLFLLNCLDEDGNLMEPVKVHPRIDAKRSFICDSVKDPKFACDCLVLDMGFNKLSRHLMGHIPKESLTKEQALHVIAKWSNDDGVDRALWETFIGRYGSVFLDELSGKIDPKVFLFYQPGGQGETVLDSILMESKEEVVQFFVESGWLTKEVVLDALRSQEPNDVAPIEIVEVSEVVEKKVEEEKVEEEKQEEIVPEVLEVEPVPLRYTLLNRVYGSKLTPELKKFLMLVKSFGITKDDVVSLNPNFLSSIFTGYSTFSYGGIDIHYLDGTKEIIGALDLTKKDFLTSESSPLLASMLCVQDEHKNWVALEILVKDLGLTRQDVLSNFSVKHQIMASSDLMLEWLKEKGLIIDGDLDKIKRYEEILFN